MAIPGNITYRKLCVLGRGSFFAAFFICACSVHAPAMRFTRLAGRIQINLHSHNFGGM
jgi:hypothetical protein